jgi:hypothetical protein
MHSWTLRLSRFSCEPTLFPPSPLKAPDAECSPIKSHARPHSRVTHASGSCCGWPMQVDMDLWRGWTWQEILLRIPYDNWQEYEGGLMHHPVITKTLINVVIYLIGDWMSQVRHDTTAVSDSPPTGG